MLGKTGLEFEMMLTNRRNGLKTIRSNSKGQVPRAGLGWEANLPSEQRASGRRAGLPSWQEGSSVGLSEFNTDAQDSPRRINKACRGSSPPRQDALCRCGYLCMQKLHFQMPGSQAAASRSSRELGKNRRSLIHLGYGICQCNMGCLAALQLH